MKDAGREQFRADVEDIFRRNGIAYMLTEGGHIERLVPPVLQDALDQLETNTGDMELDRLLDTAPRKFLNPNPETRREALEALWDVWERLKTLDGQGNKKAQANAMLDKTAGTFYLPSSGRLGAGEHYGTHRHRKQPAYSSLRDDPGDACDE